MGKLGRGFDEWLRAGPLRSPHVEFMGSDGVLVDTVNFSGLKSILSGPVCGLVGYALTSWDGESKRSEIRCAARHCTCVAVHVLTRS